MVMYRWEPGGGGVCHRHHFPLCATLPPQTNSLSVANLKRFLLLYLTWYRRFCSFIFWNKNIKTHAYSRFLNGHTSYSEILKVRFLRYFEIKMLFTNNVDGCVKFRVLVSQSHTFKWLTRLNRKKNFGAWNKIDNWIWGNLQNRKNIFWRDFR